MTTAVIDRLRVRWRPSSPAFPERARCDALVDDLVHGGRLADALDRSGGGFDRGEVCVRRVDVPPVTIVFDEPDGALADAWADVVAAAIVEAERRGDVVRYRSRADALVDVVLSVVAGDLSRWWAWRQLGLWPVDHAGAVPAIAMASPSPLGPGAVDGPATSASVAAGLEVALLAAPELVVGVLAEAARRGALAAVARALGPRRFARVVAVTARAAGAPAEVVDRIVSGADAITVFDDDVYRTGARRERGVAPAGGPRMRRWSARDLPLIDAVRAAVRAVPEARAALAAFAALAVEPAAATSTPEWERTITAMGAATEPVQPFCEDLSPDTGHMSSQNGRAAAPAPARTEWGGLLFAIHVMRDLDLSPLHDVGTAAGLHAIGTELLARAATAEHAPRAPEPADAALLAFCGVRPGDEPPVPAADATNLAAAFADRIASSLAARLDVAEPTPELLATVFPREAEVTTDPGWFELRFDLDSVTTDVRRAGLDLDPGPVPWIGAVVVFTYAAPEEWA